LRAIEFHCLSGDVSFGHEARDLNNFLFNENFTNAIRPRYNYSQRIDVKVNFALNSISLLVSNSHQLLNDLLVLSMSLQDSVNQVLYVDGKINAV
jgi:hypothetical protein